MHACGAHTMAVPVRIDPQRAQPGPAGHTHLHLDLAIHAASRRLSSARQARHQVLGGTLGACAAPPSAQPWGYRSCRNRTAFVTNGGLGRCTSRCSPWARTSSLAWTSVFAARVVVSPRRCTRFAMRSRSALWRTTRSVSHRSLTDATCSVHCPARGRACGAACHACTLPVRMLSVLRACAASGEHTFLRIWLRVFLAAHRRGRAVQEADQGDAHAVRPYPAGALPPCAIALCAVRLCGAARRLLRLPAPYVSPCRRAVPSARLRRSVCCVACTLGDNSSDQCSVCCLCYSAPLIAFILTARCVHCCGRWCRWA